MQTKKWVKNYEVLIDAKIEECEKIMSELKKYPQVMKVIFHNSVEIENN
jgi:hypothetical protein